MRRTSGWIAIAALVTVIGPAIAASSRTQSISFTRSVINLESYAGSLQAAKVPSAHVAPQPDSANATRLYFGEIFRQLPGDAPTSREHAVPFAVLVRSGIAIQAWADANLNGDLTDDASPPLFAYPSDPAARAFLIPLRWSARYQGKDVSIERLVRIVIDPPESENFAPNYRIQDVYGMLGQIEVGGASRSVLLFDANADGLYTRGNGDGMFVDMEGNRSFTIDPMRSDFGPFAIPFTMLDRSLSVDSVSVDGQRVTLRDLGTARPLEPPARGRLAPDFSFVDMNGKLQRLSAHRGKPTVVYFWASWCATCRGQAAELERVFAHPTGTSWDMLGIDLDTERANALRFRAEFGIQWPTSFSSGYTSEDPVARLYQESAVGVFYVVGTNGVLADKVTTVEALKAALEKLGASASPSGPTGQN
jgi:thiol-disulfide isomerase/thioredoxin